MTDNKITETIEPFKQILSIDDINPAIRNILFPTDIIMKEMELNKELINVIYFKLKI